MQCRSNFTEEFLSGLYRRTPSRGTDSPRSRGASRCTRRRILRVSDIKLDRFDWEAERLGGNDGNRRPRAGSNVLSSDLHIHGTIGMNGEIALARVSAPAPCM